MKVTRNFDLKKLVKTEATALWLNQYGSKMAQSIVEGLDKGIDIEGNRFDPGGDFTHKSTHDGHPHKRPLVRSGRLRKSIKKLPATAQKLTFWIKSNVKSKARWNIEVDGKKSSGTRSRRGVNYGAMNNQGFKTSKDSMIPNKNVKQRNWFGISSKFLVGGSEWKKLKTLAQYWDEAMKTRMKEFK
tara:strand:- start:2165 stop:2722 length:558 start_codon:yes stop_codon:yes gene_type:complete